MRLRNHLPFVIMILLGLAASIVQAEPVGNPVEVVMRRDDLKVIDRRAWIDREHLHGIIAFENPFEDQILRVTYFSDRHLSGDGTVIETSSLSGTGNFPIYPGEPFVIRGVFLVRDPADIGLRELIDRQEFIVAVSTDPVREKPEYYISDIQPTVSWWGSGSGFNRVEITALFHNRTDKVLEPVASQRVLFGIIFWDEQDRVLAHGETVAPSSRAILPGSSQKITISVRPVPSVPQSQIAEFAKKLAESRFSIIGDVQYLESDTDL